MSYDNYQAVIDLLNEERSKRISKAAYKRIMRAFNHFGLTEDQRRALLRSPFEYLDYDFKPYLDGCDGK